MTTDELKATRRRARRAGLLYLLAGSPAPFGIIYVPRLLMAPGDAAATADHVRASTTLIRLGMASELAVAAAFIYVALALYRLFKQVDEARALAMVVLFAVSVPISFVNVLNEVAAMALAGGAPYLPALGREQLDALVYLCLRLHQHGLLLAQVFWGLWLLPMGLLAIRSGFIPRGVGVCAILAGCAYVVSSCGVLFLPQQGPAIAQVALVFELGEMVMIFWLLIWGARQPKLAVAG